MAGNSCCDESRLDLMAVQAYPDGGAVWEDADLDEVAQLGDDPESLAACLAWGGADAAGQWLAELSVVGDFADDRLPVLPDACDAGAAAVPDAVARELADGEDEVVALVV